MPQRKELMGNIDDSPTHDTHSSAVTRQQIPLLPRVSGYATQYANGDPGAVKGPDS
jgi:hypothetical protein